VATKAALARREEQMLNSAKCVATLATKDVAAARAFYVDTLGLVPTMDDESGLGFTLDDGSSLMVYARPGHRAPENTGATFLVSNVEAEATDLRQRGVSLLDYDLPDLGIKTVEGIASDDSGGKVAWFKDPDGNILAITQMPA
jgi:catechol 2,3-dioxygenase-like lactoylglutathione lyase family enzyme